ncbi:MAG: DEAD/DEAH box helicase [Deltaproteobacteria bacterium]|nr:DEAD/DEAH box helicase [Deltaproteobacteria bacterium]
MSVFHRFHPHLRHAIVHDVGWRELRAVQELAAEAILDGKNCVVLAPTAGGKTEAAIFPVLSQILAEDRAPVAALYVCPIRALLNNQEARIDGYARMVGLASFKWHGDVNASRKRRFLESPAHLLLITPESLEVILISQKAEAERLFAGLGTVVIDEVHAFAGDDRGVHLVSLLERLTAFCGRDLQRVGLSATVGNPDEIGLWLQGSSRRAYARVDPHASATQGPTARRAFVLDLVDDDQHAALVAATLCAGKKSLLFVESRSHAERFAAALSGRGVEVFVHHSAVSRADRERAERQFASGTNTAIVCTSTMELGIDVGDLDHVVQLDAPSTVASLLQRMGRTGRRPGTVSNCTLLCGSSEALLQAVALVRLAEQGWVEDVRPPGWPAHVVAHQVLALCLQQAGISRHRIWPWIGGAAPLAGFGEAHLRRLVDTMVERDVLHEADGLLTLGREGERLYGRQNFFELYAVFDSPSIVRVLHHSTDIGSVQAAFLRMRLSSGDSLCFRLGGRPWSVRAIDWRRGVCQVEPAQAGRIPVWLGTPLFLAERLCQEMKSALHDGHLPPGTTPAAAADLADLRTAYEGIVDPEDAPLEDGEDGLRWHTFAGGAINRLLAAGIERVGGDPWVAGNLSLHPRQPTGAAEARSAIQDLAALDWHDVAAGIVAASDDAGLGKFEPCLPREMAARVAVGQTYGGADVGAFLRGHQVAVVRG